MKRNKLILVLAGFTLATLLSLLTMFASDAKAQFHGQQGVTRYTCNADNVYIYQYATTRSERRGRMGRGWAFRVYHYADANWAFGVHNGTRVSGYVLREKLCTR
ncbi:MAG TPA: hypothetical protein VF666_11215 [Pyrinomonadaceae bacterium]